jgi:O-antigen ligase
MRVAPARVQRGRQGVVQAAIVSFGALLAASAGIIGASGSTSLLAFYAVALLATLLTLTLVVNNARLMALGLVSLGISLAPSDGLRLVTSLTYSDALIVAAVPFLIWSFLSRVSLPTLPTWLFIGAGLIIFAALIIEELPPVSYAEALFQYRNLETGEVGTPSNFALAAQLLIALVIVPVIVGLTVVSWSQARRLINLWLIGSAISCIVALLAAFGHIDLQQVITGHNYSVQAHLGQAGRYTGLAVQPVLLGISAAMAVPIALSRMTSTRQTVLYGSLTGVYCLAALISGSRSSLIGIAAALLLVFAWRARARLRIVFFVILGGAAILITGVSSSSLSTLQRLFGGNALASSSAATSDSGRLNHYSEALHAFFARPLTGYGFQGLRGAHNIILELLSSGGGLALIGYFVIIGGALHTATRIRPKLPTNLATDTLGLIGAIIVFLVVSMVDNASLDRFVYLPIGFVLGLSFILQRKGVRHLHAEPTVHNEAILELPRFRGHLNAVSSDAAERMSSHGYQSWWETWVSA